MPQTILIVDDDESQGQQLAHYIQNQYGFHTLVTSSARDALERLMLKLQPIPNAIITQSGMTDMSGAQLVRKIRYADKQIPVIVMCPPLQDIMQACIQAGANDILIKPFSRPQLYLSIQNILRAASLDREVARLGRFHQNQMHLQDLVGKSPALQAMKKQAKQLIHSKRPIYLEGEKGTGKESVARVIHGSGELCGQPFIVFQPGSYLKTEEALDQLHLAFYAAKGGTLLIKHIDQASEQTLEMLQALIAQPIDHMPRIMATSTMERKQLLRLAPRSVDQVLNHVMSCHILVPTIHACESDIPSLVDHYLSSLSDMGRYPVYGWSNDALTLMRSYAWPGNHPEMQKIVQHILFHCDQPQVQSCHVVTAFAEYNLSVLNELEQQHNVSSLIEEATSETSRVSVLDDDGNVRSISELEGDMIRYAIKHYKGKMTEVARRLGIGRSTLYRKLQDHNIDEAA